MSRERDIADHLPLHPFEMRILMALIDGPSYGTRIVEQIEERVGAREKIYPANLYRRVRDLLKRGLVEETDTPEGADPRRTYVRLTALGKTVARAEALRLQELVEDATRHRLLADR